MGMAVYARPPSPYPLVSGDHSAGSTEEPVRSRHVPAVGTSARAKSNAEKRQRRETAAAATKRDE